MQQRYKEIDLFKYIASLLIIAIHTNKYTAVNENLDFFFVDIVCRLAVPFFAVCSGYFLGLKSENGDKTHGFKASVLKQLKKLILLYAVWSVLYLIYSVPNWIKTGWFSASAFLDYAIAVLKIGPHYHLWYLLSLIIALPIFYIVIKTIKSRKSLIIIMTALWFVKAVTYAYSDILPSKVVRVVKYMDKFGQLKESVFCILPLLILGVLISRQKSKSKPTVNKVGFVICFALMSIEAFVIKVYIQDSTSYIFMTLPTAYFLFNVILNTNINISEKICTVLGRASLLVYCMHPMISEVLEPCVDNSFQHWGLTAVISTAVSLTYINIKKYICIKRR